MPARPSPDRPGPPDREPPREPHRIRLRGPWEWRPDGGPAATVRLPFAAAEPGTLRRSFNTPTGLEDGTRVRPRVERSGPPTGDPAAAALNGHPVTDGEDVTDRLARPNHLTVPLTPGAGLTAATLELHLPTGPGG